MDFDPKQAEELAADGRFQAALEFAPALFDVDADAVADGVAIVEVLDAHALADAPD